MMVANNHVFHHGDDVEVIDTDYKGYIFAFAEAENFALIKTFDGKDSQWIKLDELRHFIYVPDVALPGSECL